MNIHRASVPAPVAPPAAGTHQIVAHHLALDRARGVAVFTVGVLVLALAGWLAAEVAEALASLALLAIPLLVYGWDAVANVKQERRRVYGQEIRDNRDHDDDGIVVVSDPFHSIQVPSKGGGVDDVIIPKPSNSARGQPIMDGWGVSAADLVAFAFEVEANRGLQERAWVGKDVEQFILPSGRAVTQKLLRSLQEALAEHGMASKPAGKWQMDLEAQRIAEHLKSS